MRCAHAQKLPSQSVSTALTGFKSDLKPAVCKFYQKGMCQQQKDHETGGGGLFYRHICATCFAVGKEHRHMSKDCRVKRSNKNE